MKFKYRAMKFKLHRVALRILFNGGAALNAKIKCDRILPEIQSSILQNSENRQCTIHHMLYIAEQLA